MLFPDHIIIKQVIREFCKETVVLGRKWTQNFGIQQVFFFFLFVFFFFLLLFFFFLLLLLLLLFIIIRSFVSFLLLQFSNSFLQILAVPNKAVFCNSP